MHEGIIINSTLLFVMTRIVSYNNYIFVHVKIHLYPHGLLFFPVFLESHKDS